MTDNRTPLQIAEALDDYGFNVLPAKAGGKAPSVSWKRFQAERSTTQLPQLFDGRPTNYWIATGTISGVVVLDVDSPEGDAYWREILGDEIMDTTTCVRTAKGHHYYFRLRDGMDARSWSLHDDATGVSFDVRGDGSGVIAPPSVHESGHVYEWVRGPE